MSETTTVTPSKPETPSVLLELGLGNSLPPVTEAPDATTTAPIVAESPAAAAPDAKTEEPAKTETVEVKTDTAPKPETSDIGKDGADLARLNKQLKDLRDTWTQERQFTKDAQRQIQHLNQQIGVLTKKLDGTYDEAKDGPKAVPPEALVDEAKKSERVASSHWAAVEQYGEDYVMKTIWNDEAPFRKFDGDPVVQARVFNAKLPILEAIKVVKEAEAKAKYGADPEAMRQTIEKEVRADLETKVRKEILKELKQKGGDFEAVKGLGGVAGSTESAKSSEPPRLVFESLFPGFQKTAG